MIERENKGLPLSQQADLLGLSRSSLYYQPCGPSEKEIRIKHRIDEIYTDYPFYGSRRIHQQLRREGEVVGENTIAKYMRDMGITAVCPGPNLSKRQKAAYIYPYLLRHVTPSYPNHVWGIDGRPFGRLVNVSSDTAHHQGCVSLPWRSKEPSSLGLVSFQGTRASRAKEADFQYANVQEWMDRG